MAVLIGGVGTERAQPVVKYAAAAVANIAQSPEFRLRIGAVPQVFAVITKLATWLAEVRACAEFVGGCLRDGLVGRMWCGRRRR